MRTVRRGTRSLPATALTAIVSLGLPFAANAQLATGLDGATGSAIGPDGALYVPESAVGKITRIDPDTGEKSTFASDLPATIPEIGIGGVMDVEFIGDTAYALVTLVGADVGGSDIVGIYRVDGPSSYTVIADIGTFAVNNPPLPEFFVPSGVQYALQAYGGGFLVTDGHHNRVLRVTLEGAVSELIAFDNIVPTGLATSGHTVYMAEAGPTPHAPEDGKIVAFEPWSSAATEIASGARLLVDVEFGRGRRLFALSQGVWDGVTAGSPALPYTGALLRVNGDGSFTVVEDYLDRPTSLEVVGNTAYVVSLNGEVWKFDDISTPSHGVPYCAIDNRHGAYGRNSWLDDYFFSRTRQGSRRSHH